MKMDENNVLCGPSTCTTGPSDDSCTMPSFPWFPRQTKRKSRLGTHRREKSKQDVVPNIINRCISHDENEPSYPIFDRLHKSRLGTHERERNNILQDVVPNVINVRIPNEKNDPSFSAVDGLHMTDTKTNTSITAEMEMMDVASTPVFVSKATTLDLDFTSSVSPLSDLRNNSLSSFPTFQTTALESANNVKLPDLHRINSSDNKQVAMPFIKTPQAVRFTDQNRCNHGSSGLENIKGTPSKSCLKKPVRLLSGKVTSLKPELISEKFVPTPKKEVRFIEPAAPAPKPLAQPPTKVKGPQGLREVPSLLIVKGKSYQVHSVLGKGGSSVVYSVFDAEVDEYKALKRVVLPEEDDCIAQGYLDEVETLEKLQSCNRIIKMFDNDLVNENGESVLYVIMEKGENDLSKIMRNVEESEKLDTIIYYWKQMLLIVNEIHKYDIIHSDLKPANFVSVKNKLKLIDFGIASSMPEDKTSIYKDCFSGTLNYMSPEAISFVNNTMGPTGYRISKKSDVWSLGCILYSWVYGHLPFHNSKRKWEKLHDIASADKKVDFPEKEGIPVGLMDAMKCCLEKDPALRPTVAEIIQKWGTDYTRRNNVS